MPSYLSPPPIPLPPLPGPIPFPFPSAISDIQGYCDQLLGDLKPQVAIASQKNDLNKVIGQVEVLCDEVLKIQQWNTYNNGQ